MFNLIEWIYLRQKNNLAYYDSLTGCKSRLFYDRMIELEYGSMDITVIVVDVDDLKYINDTYGHNYGSEVIRSVAEKLKKIDGAYDVCRIGGDEFVVIGKYGMSDNCIKHIDDISYGIYNKDGGTSVHDAVHSADVDMYSMKNRKKRCT